MRHDNYWTFLWVVMVFLPATIIGIRNLEWFLNTTCLINTMPDISKYCK